jgi:hypothetical protein
MYIGSGDIHALLSGKETKAHEGLLQRFVSGIKPYYNALSSPIDACRAGAILEDRYILTLENCFFPQYVVQSDEMNIFKASLDFGKIDKGKLVDFHELKSISFNDFLKFIPLETNEERVKYIKKSYKAYYNQVQEQLYCSKLDKAHIVFLSVTSYEDEDNYSRNIQPNEFIVTEIKRDEDVISLIKERGYPFQMLKDYYTNK